MKSTTVAIIAEYNPFHNGHAYQIVKAKELTGADYAIVIMSGNFVQRGEPAIMDKYLRTKMALENGANLVFELPVCFATGGAKDFAYGAVSLLSKLGFVDYLCFGSECGDINSLKKTATFLNNEPEEFKNLLKNNLKSGLTYPLARKKALLIYSLSSNPFSLTTEDVKLLDSPNNTLGIEYLKALVSINSQIEPITIKRIGNDYNSLELSSYSSASAIRYFLNELNESPTCHENYKEGLCNPFTYTNSLMNNSILSSCMPSNIFEIIKPEYKKTFPISTNDISSLLSYRLLYESAESLSTCLDVDEELANLVKKASSEIKSFDSLVEAIKSKKYTRVTIMRALIHILLNLKKSEYTNIDSFPYLRLLGLKKGSSHLLKITNDLHPDFIITKLADAKKQLTKEAYSILENDLNATALYNQLIASKFGTILPAEQASTHPIIFE